MPSLSIWNKLNNSLWTFTNTEFDTLFFPQLRKFKAFIIYNNWWRVMIIRLLPLCQHNLNRSVLHKILIFSNSNFLFIFLLSIFLLIFWRTDVFNLLPWWQKKYQFEKGLICDIAMEWRNLENHMNSLLSKIKSIGDENMTQRFNKSKLLVRIVYKTTRVWFLNTLSKKIFTLTKSSISNIQQHNLKTWNFWNSLELFFLISENDMHSTLICQTLIKVSLIYKVALNAGCST